mmetsp:Transcript_492/g.1235  ORF Transcript_492/g.1235 Transcript_492/m.1235 type:complete len:273 (+) Transcript_492:432-1250(+)
MTSIPQTPSKPTICSPGRSTSVRSHSSAITCAACTTWPLKARDMPKSSTPVPLSPEPSPLDFSMACWPQTLARPTAMMPDTQHSNPSQWNAMSFRCRKVTAKTAAKTISAPRSSCQTLAGMYRNPMPQRPVAMMSKREGMLTRTTFFDQGMPLVESVICPPGEASAMSGTFPPGRLLLLHGSQRLMLPSKTRASVMATNMMKVTNHGFWKVCSWPSVPTDDIVKQIFIVMVFREPHTSSPVTYTAVWSADAMAPAQPGPAKRAQGGTRLEGA